MIEITFRELTDKMMQRYREQDYAGALKLVEDKADLYPEQSARITFWKMCLLSLCGRAEDVISVFQRGLDSGLWWAERQFLDSDLDAVRELPEFKRLAGISHEKYEEARKHIKPDQTILVPEASVSGSYPLLIALHGGAGSRDSNLEYWEGARQKGWLVLSPQSSQPLYPGAYSWIDGEQGLTDLAFYLEMLSREYPIDSQRVVIAGFSQGGGMAVHAALSGRLDLRGFISVATYWADASSLTAAKESRPVRGYFISGGKDRTLDKIREIKEILKANQIPFVEEMHPELGHEFPPDFEKSFDKAIDFIFEEHE